MTTEKNPHRYIRAAALLAEYPSMPEDVIARGIGDIPVGVTDNKYTRVAALLDYDVEMKRTLVAEAIGCAPSSVDNYRCAYREFREPELMQIWINELSRESKARKREENRQAA
jgi:carbamate kinase